ncbi:MAG TPA: hypothetical protein ENJ95_23340 [Bacteroidetes bacterium]|nr:hypothetical protein [Bacteroidota bacterium]
MNKTVLANVYRFFGFALLQGLVFQHIGLGWEDFPYLYIIVFPVFIFLLPLRMPNSLVMLLAFAIGLLVDIFYDSLGLHASAAVFTAFVRPLVIKIIEPRGGYNVNLSPTAEHLGIQWFFKYAGILLFLHLFFYFSVEAFTFVYIVDILKKTFVSYIVSMIFVVIYQLLFNPSD